MAADPPSPRRTTASRRSVRPGGARAIAPTRRKRTLGPRRGPSGRHDSNPDLRPGGNPDSHRPDRQQPSVEAEGSPRSWREGRRERKRRDGPLWWRLRRGLFLVGFAFCALVAGAVYYIAALPLPKAPALSQTSFVYDDKGNILASFSASQNRISVPLKQVPPVLINAIVSTEDRNFFSEGALDPLSIARALLKDAEGGNLQGGSTITQQYVKQTYTAGQRTLLRKLKEAVLAEKVQRKYSKTQILQDYLNTIYFGRGAYGVEAASESYFNKDVSQLNLAEASLLAGLIQDPEGNDPAHSLSGATSRQEIVLKGMLRDKRITDSQMRAIEATPIPSYTNMNPNSGVGVVMNAAAGDKYFIEAIREQLIARYGPAKVYGGGLRVTTTLDPTLQAAAYASIYQNPNGLNPAAGDPAGALVSIDDQGHVRAMVGGQDYETSQVNLALGTAGGGSGRQAGSTFKAFLLAQLVKEGYSVESTVPAPQEVVVAHGNSDGTDWDLKNFEGEAPGGNVSVIQATADSINTAYAQLVEKIGAPALVQLAEELGINPDEIGPYPSLVLGTADVSPLEMASGYSTFAAGGVHNSPTLIAKVADANGTPQSWSVNPPHQVLTPAQDAVVDYTLQQVILQGTGSRAAINVPIAGKTGTTDQATDAWFIGYTPMLTTAVWMGYPGSSRTLDGFRGQAVYQGGDLPAELFQTYMTKALTSEPQWAGKGFAPPGSLQGMPLNIQPGTEPGITFPQGTGPAAPPATTPPATTPAATATPTTPGNAATSPSASTGPSGPPTPPASG